MDKTLRKLKEQIYSCKSFNTIKSTFAGAKAVQLSGLYGSLVSFFLAYLIEQFEKTILFLTTDIDYAEKLHDDLELLLGRGRAGFFPMGETGPYDDRDPNPSLVRLRAEVLNLLTVDHYQAVIAPASAILKKVPQPGCLKAKQMMIKKSGILPFDNFIMMVCYS